MKESTEDIWLQSRKNGIGGSECSALLGLNPYMSNVDLWKSKVFGINPKVNSSNSYIQFGKDNESLLIEDFKKKYIDKYDVIHNDFHIIYSSKYDFMLGTLDGELTDNETGKKGILEIKTCHINSYNRSKWTDSSFPDNYYCQILHYLSVMGYDYAILYARLYYFNGDTEDREYTIHREDKLGEIAYLERIEKDFWYNNVLGKKEPNLLIRIKH